MMKLDHCGLVVVALAGLLLAENDGPATSFQRGLDALAVKNDDDTLDSLEQAVIAQPDDVRYASEYRQAAIQAKAFDRSVKFFEKLVADHPRSANAYLNYGFALVDEIPAAGSITQVILANNALAQFSKAVELHPSWIAYYTRGNSYLFWPKVFNRTPLGVADLEKAVQIQQSGGKHQYYSRAYVSLGDAYWKLDEPPKARAIWRRGLREFPGNEQLRRRLALNDEGMKALLDEVYDPSRRVNTDLRDLWSEP